MFCFAFILFAKKARIMFFNTLQFVLVVCVVWMLMGYCFFLSSCVLFYFVISDCHSKNVDLLVYMYFDKLFHALLMAFLRLLCF